MYIREVHLKTHWNEFKDNSHSVYDFIDYSGYKTIFIPTLISAVVIFVTFVVSLCFYVLSQIFKAATEYKNEVDLTV